MASRRGPTKTHTNLLMELTKACAEDNFKELKTQVRAKEFGALRAGEIEKLKDMRELLEKLERKRIFKPNSYAKLKELFSAAEFEDGIDIIDDYLAESTVDPMDHEESSNNNNSGLMSRPPSQFPVSSGPAAMTPNFNPQPTRDQDDASPILPVAEPYQAGRGYLLFVNNFVNKGPENRRREGADIDEKNIKSLFQEFIKSFALRILRDLTKAELMRILTDVSGEIERGDFKSLICIISSHGERNEVTNKFGQKGYQEGFLTIDDQLVTEDEITLMFDGDKLPKLKGHPKVFIFQCCRGRAYGRGVLDHSDSTEVPPAAEVSAGATMDVSDDIQPAFTLPTNADMLIAHSTSKGTKAWRNNADGSWYISHFCEVLKMYHKRDHFMDMLVTVNSEVAKREGSEKAAKQMPCIVSTFTKKFILGASTQ